MTIQTTRSAPALTIRPLYSVEDCKHFQEVQRRVWVGEDDTDIVPIHVLITQAKNGGLLLGAFAVDGPEATGGMVGIAFGWPGFAQVNGSLRLKFCSHIVGVLPNWQGKGVGLRLKMAQRAHLLDEGRMAWATWTYDPIQRINGVFNLHRLGATCNTYLRNVYGEMQDYLNAGMPTDRFQVDWHLDSERVRCALSPAQQVPDWTALPLDLLSTRPISMGSRLHRPVAQRPALDGRPLAVPLPESVASLRTEGTLLMEWRLFLREVLEGSFAAGYTAVDCTELPDRGWHYILVPTEQRPFDTLPWP